MPQNENPKYTSVHRLRLDCFRNIRQKRGVETVQALTSQSMRSSRRQTIGTMRRLGKRRPARRWPDLTIENAAHPLEKRDHVWLRHVSAGLSWFPYLHLNRQRKSFSNSADSCWQGKIFIAKHNPFARKDWRGMRQTASIRQTASTDSTRQTSTMSTAGAGGALVAGPGSPTSPFKVASQILHLIRTKCFWNPAFYHVWLGSQSLSHSSASQKMQARCMLQLLSRMRRHLCRWIVPTHARIGPQLALIEESKTQRTQWNRCDNPSHTATKMRVMTSANSLQYIAPSALKSASVHMALIWKHMAHQTQGSRSKHASWCAQRCGPVTFQASSSHCSRDRPWATDGHFSANNFFT